jgi:DNA-binding beta-propeller fold protein YncE
MIRKLFSGLFVTALLIMSFMAEAQTAVKKTFTTPAQKSNQQGGKIYDKRYLYVAVPGIRNYLGYGGHGILVFDMDNNHRFVKRIKTGGMLSDSLMNRMKQGGYASAKGDDVPSNVKGIAVSIPLNSVYVSTLESLQRIDLTTDKIVWEKQYKGGCDRMAISPDGKTMYLPSLEKDFWNVVDCENGNIIAKIPVTRRAHNTIYGASGDRVYLDDIASPWLFVADAKTHTIVNKVGPFYNNVRPFTINGKETLAFVTCDSLLGFEVGDLKTGKKLASVAVEGWEKGPVRRHGNPSHGIGLTPDEKEIWVCDGHNMRIHIFKNEPPYQQLSTIPLQDMPGWVTFSVDGKYAYPSSGEVIDVKSRKIIMTLTDEFNNSVGSEKMVEIEFKGGKPVYAGNQFGIGRVF